MVHTTHRPDNPAQLASEVCFIYKFIDIKLAIFKLTWLQNVIKYQLRFGSRNHYDTRWYYTKVRPATRDFLKKMADLFELHIFTLSDRPYAHKIAKILDPDGALFGTRILSRDECFTKDKKTANVR